MRWAKALVLCAIASSGCAPLRADVVEPALRQALTDPVQLAALCKTEPETLGPVSPSRLAISDIRNERGASGEGTGSATLRYTPVSKDWNRGVCQGKVRFKLSDGGGATINAGTVRVWDLQITPS